MSRKLIVIMGAWLPVLSVHPQTVRAQDVPPPLRPLSPFATQKAEQLLRDRLPCLGCHRLDGEGGQIGPDLSTVGARRAPEAVYAIIRDPAAMTPGTIMPQTPMSRATLELIASYLAARTDVGAQPAAPPQNQPHVGAQPAAPVQNQPNVGAPHAAPLMGRDLYVRRCAPCHGDAGHGDGFNAEFLPVPPTAHTDSAYMSTRPDDSLFDAIYAGGYVMNRSNRMPAFGRSLTREQIHSLVRYMRELCRCAGPAWSRDGRRGR